MLNKLFARSQRLIIVSNRLPFTAALENGEYVMKESSGGLVSGLSSFLKSWENDYVWVGWPGLCPDGEAQARLRESAMRDFSALPVFLGDDAMESFYQGFCNNAIWPLFHYFPSLAKYSENDWKTYVDVNELFCQSLLELTRPGDIIWIHDYHLMLLPRMLRRKMDDLTIGFFLHIPFPSYEIFRLIPRAWGTAIIDGMLGADLIGFHTYDYTQYFLRNVLRFTGRDHNLGTIALSVRTIKADTFPMGIDFAKFHYAAQLPEVRQELDNLDGMLAGRKMILSVDRLDYTKGILNRLEGYELFLENNPQFHERVVFIIVVVPSRIGVDHYQQMKVNIDRLIGQINGRFGTVNWTPLVYQFRSLEFPALAAMYGSSDVALITPLRDGMNLVAKEYIASRTNGRGVLILSEMAGAAKELGEAIIINPNHKEDIARALKEAVEMPLEEQALRLKRMQGRLKTYDINRWADDFLQALDNIKEVQKALGTRIINRETLNSIRESYLKAHRRAIFLDYDGTMVPFAPHPMNAVPDPELCSLLTLLSEDDRNDVVLISGRDRNILSEWFGNIPVAFVAEHGAWIRERDKSWRLLMPLTGEWKESLYPILRTYSDRLPGAFVEEKEFSLAWHYRQADPEYASLRARELIDQITEFTANINIQIIHGNRVVEIRNAGVNKGAAAMSFLSRKPYDFILAMGDDWTDEEMFKVMPPGAFTVKIGIAPSHARFNLADFNGARTILREVSE
jgi:trehalose 6-phosphate synthase/phosphatase